MAEKKATKTKPAKATSHKPAKHSHNIDDEWMTYSSSPVTATEVEYRCDKCGELVVFTDQAGNP